MALPNVTSWHDIARDVVLLTMPQHGPTELRPVLEDVLKEYSLSTEDMVALFENPDFSEMLQDEYDKAKDYGSDASHVYMIRDMVTDYGARLHQRMLDNMAVIEPKDQLKYYELILKSAGWLEPRQGKDINISSNPQVNVQVINVPRLNNPKLNHLVPVLESDQ